MDDEGALRVWWIPQLPMKPFFVDVDSVEIGRKIVDVLVDYDLFQHENNIKPDYCNASGLSIFVNGDWEDLEDEAA